MTLRTASHLLAILFALFALTACDDDKKSGSASTWPVTASAGSNGTITPATSTVNHGSNATFTVTPDTGYVVENVSGCGGTLNGTTYATGPITGACTVTATFALNTYTVTATAGSNGSITPASSTASHGSTVTFTVTPDTNYVVESVSGCGGTLDGTTYTTGAITNACTITATFVLKSYEVTASAGPNGTITPATSMVGHGATAAFAVTPDTNYVVESVSGCNGTLSGATYTTGAVTGACTVSATFAPSYSVGGSVTGLATGASVMLLNNDSETVTVTANGAFTFPARLASGGSYNVTVNTQPVGQQCTVANGAGDVSGADVTNVAVSCVSEVTALYPVNGVNWNDYVKNDGADIRSATDAACSGDETGGYSACIHGGERRVFRVPSVASCTGLVATDDLDAFDWRCDDTQGYVRFVSKLKADKRLADLIDFTAPEWKDNAVTVTDGDTTVAASASRKWWSNPLVIDNDGMTLAQMNAAGTLYLLTANPQGNYAIGADKVGLIIKPGVTLRGSGTVAGRKFLWIEGSVNVPTGVGLNLSSVRFSVLRALEVRNAPDRGIYIGNSHNNSLARVLIANSHIGINLYSSPNNSLVGVTVVHGGNGIINENSDDNIVAGLTAANNSTYGVYPSTSTGNVFSSVVAASNTSAGFYNNAMSNSTYSDVAAAYNYYGVSLFNSLNNTFTGLLKLGNNDRDCNVSGGTNPGLFTISCANDGTSNATLTTGIALAASFAGKVAADEPVNASDTDGAATYPADPAAFDWTGFANDFRAWGKDGGLPFPNANNRGRWTSGNGRIWDWSVAAADTVIKDVLALPTGDNTITHTWSDKSTSTFLRHAVELDGDGDGLCESREVCLYTPNIGAYQGHGALVSAGPFTDGTISGVRLLKYESNGR